MARYADIDVLLEHLTTSDKGNFRTAITQWLEMHQVEDVAPVIHAHWERHFKRSGVYEDLWWYCSNCNGRTSEEYAPYWWSYCPYCGAKMDGEVETYKEVGKRMADGFAKGFENNVKSVGQQFCNGEE